MKTIAVSVGMLAIVNVAHAEQVESPSIQKSATYSIDFGSHMRWFGDTSAAILTTESFGGTRLTIGRSLTQTRVPRRDLDVGVFARWMFATVDGTFFGDLNTNLTQHGLAGGVRFDAPILWRFRLVGQAEVGMAHTALTVTEAEMTPVDDSAWAPYGTVTLGTDLGLHEGPRFRLGLGVDVGYTVTMPVDLRALPGDRPDEELSIETDYASLGKLDTRGWTYSLALRGAF